MALTINVQPSSIKGALSSIIYQAYDTDYALTGFYYEYSIYIWSGSAILPAQPRYVIQRFPDVYGGYRSWIDVSKLVTQFIDEISFTIGAANPIIGTGAVYVAVKVQGKWTGGSGTAVTSNMIIATEGYSYVLEGFNDNFSEYVLSDRNEIWLTTDTEYDYLWFDASKVTSYILDGSIVIGNTFPTSSSNYIKGVELKQLLVSNGLWGVDTTIQFFTSTGSKTIPIKFNCVNKYGCVTMLFKNRYGVYEGFSMNGVSKVSMTPKREEYQKAIYDTTNLNNAWSYGVPTKSYYNIQGVYRQTLNTNWIDESYVAYIQQMILSNQCYLYYEGKLVAVQIIDTAFDVKRKVNDKLIMYTLVVEYGQPLINSIVR